MVESNSRGATGGDPRWERVLIEKLATESLKEQRRARRWGIFFKFLLFAYLAVLLVLSYPKWLPESGKDGEGHTALVKLDGVIVDGGKAGADQVNEGLKNAFEDENTKGVVLSINSPGGSPVQSGRIYEEVLRLRKEHPDIPVYAVIGDICASGGYYVAAAADRIYADRASLVGSIGVRYDGFGFVDAMGKLGIERRLLTAGENKALLDPFLPLKPGQEVHMQGLLDEIHEQFIDRVRTGRGDRLKDEPGLFSGLVWSGERAVALGLVDELSDAQTVAREVVGAETIKDFTEKKALLERFAERLGSAFASGLWSLGASGLR